MQGSDAELLERIKTGDGTAFAAFYDRHAPRVLGLLVRWLGHRQDAEDILQETFWQVWSRAKQYDAARAAPEVWLLLIARSRALDRLRGRRVQANPPSVEPVAIVDPGGALEQGEAARRLREALAELPEEQRSAIALAYYAGLTYEQVAQRQAIPAGTAKTRIRLGMRRLRRLLGGSEELGS